VLRTTGVCRHCCFLHVGYVKHLQDVHTNAAHMSRVALLRSTADVLMPLTTCPHVSYCVAGGHFARCDRCCCCTWYCPQPLC
jgi:hypothetical protein